MEGANAGARVLACWLVSAASVFQRHLALVEIGRRCVQSPAPHHDEEGDTARVEISRPQLDLPRAALAPKNLCCACNHDC
eukprot:3709190-Rhodomonas_salina.2